MRTVAGLARRNGARSRSASPAEPQAKDYSDLRIIVRLLGQARSYWKHIGGVFLLTFLATPLALLTPLPLKIAVDSVVGDHPPPAFLDAILPASVTSSKNALLAVVAAMFVLIALLSQLQQLASTALTTYTSEKLVLDFRARLFRHAQRLSLTYHDAKGTADATYRIQYDAPAIQWILISGVTPFLTAAFTLGAMVLVAARIDWQLVALAFAVTPVLVSLTWASRRRLRAGWRDAKKLESSALSVVQEVLTGLRVVKAFAQEDREHERFLSHSGAAVNARIRLTIAQGFFGLLIALTTAAGTAGVLFLGVRHVESGLLTLGDLLLVMAYLTQLYGPLQTITRSIGTLQSSFASAERVFVLLDQPEDVRERPDARPIARANGHVVFRDVSFAYQPAQVVLREVSLEVEPGTRLGIVGATGAGKTTLVSLLTRFYDPDAGEILLDGTDLREYKLADLRNQFGIVLQEPVLFSTSIGENIAYARPGAGEHEIVEAAAAANAHDFVSRLPEGYDTRVGERGMRLSGGERQRISLARAFLKNAPILILDEPTSSVDTATESKIMEAMERLMEGRTAFMIAHRTSTLANCDARLELAEGAATRVGTAPRQAGRTRRRRLRWH